MFVYAEKKDSEQENSTQSRRSSFLCDKMNAKCRLCLGTLPIGPTISIQDTEFQQELNSVFHFDITHDTELPEHVCNECRETVSFWHSYYLQVQANQAQLLEEAKENALQPVENVKVESLFDVDCFETEELSVKAEFDVKNKMPVCLENQKSISGLEECLVEKNDRQLRRVRQSIKDKNDLHKETEMRDTSSKKESLAKQLENDKIIKQFFALECEICATTVESFLILLDHYRTAHKTKGYVRCCGKQFFRRYILVDHIAAHRGTIRCEICQKTYKTKRYLALHTAKSHSREEDRPFKCSKCHVSYPKQYLLRAHELLHVQQQCHICQKVLSNTQSLKVHIAQMHGDDGNHICDTCGKIEPAGLSSENEMDEKCRLCLECCVPTNATPITDEEFGSKLEMVFNFPILSEDTLPEQVCHECVTIVSDFHTYSQRVKSIQEQLQTDLKEQKFQPFEVVKIETLEDDDFYDAEMEETRERLEAEAEEQTVHVIVTRKLTKQSHTYDTDTGNVSDAMEEEEDDEDDEDFVPKVDPKDGTLKVPVRRRRRMTQVKAPPKKRIAVKTEKQTEKLEPEELAKQHEEDKRIQEFYKFECEICSLPMDSFTNLQGHYRREHGTKGYIRCCEKLFYRRFQLLDHIAAHQGTIKCEVCQKSYKSSRYLALHMMKSHSREEERPFKCDKCHQSFHKEHLLKAHQANHLSEKCPICEKVVSSKYALKTHVAHMHGSDSNQICDVCGKEFRTKQAMERHINEHMGVDVVQKVQCNVCQRWFHGKYNLRKHVRFMHIEGGQVFRCDLCPHQSPNSRALLDHKKRVHVVERFECELCGKRFKRKLYLKEHMASHTGQPLYECGICDAKFNSNANCYNHRKSKHPEEWQARRQAFFEAQRKAPDSELKKEDVS
uniref:Transcription factor grauzone n=1 Tax=Anopheles christyi TaxID=43041 RepID=A0A182JY47_9DIPT